MTAAPTAALHIPRINVETLLVPILGTSPLLVHQWSQKAKLQMLNAQQGIKTIKEPRDPQSEYEASLYRAGDDGYGIPSVAFKAATVSAARVYGKAVRMTELRQFLFFRGKMYKGNNGKFSCNQQLFLLDGTPQMREDMVTVGISGTDLRYRGEFTEWSTTLTVEYIKSSITKESVLGIIEAAGTTVGVGEWRPEKDGEFGTFKLDPSREVQVISA
jgi:hypothetical protein